MISLEICQLYSMLQNQKKWGNHFWGYPPPKIIIFQVGWISELFNAFQSNSQIQWYNLWVQGQTKNGLQGTIHGSVGFSILPKRGLPVWVFRLRWTFSTVGGSMAFGTRWTKNFGKNFYLHLFLWHREDALSACNLYSWASVSNAGPPQLITLHLMKVRSCATWNHFQKPLPLIYEYHPFPEPKYRVARLSSNANNSPCVAGIVLVTKIRLKHIDCSQVQSISP